MNSFASILDSGGDDSFSQHLFWAIGIFGLALIVLQAVFGLFIGHDGDSQSDSGGHTSGGHGFTSYLSLKSISATLLGFGFGGAYLNRIGSALGVAAFGGLCLGLLIGATYVTIVNSLYRLRSDGATFRLIEAIGRTGTVYLPIPTASSGAGEIQVAFNGRSHNVAAFTQGPPLAVGTFVRVVGLQGENALTVEKAEQYLT